MKKLFTILLMLFFIAQVQAQRNPILIEITGNVRNTDYKAFMVAVDSLMAHDGYPGFNIEKISYNYYSTDPFGNSKVFDSPRRCRDLGYVFMFINGQKYDIPYTVWDTLDYVKNCIGEHYEDEPEITFDIGGSVEFLGTHTLYKYSYNIYGRIPDNYTVYMAVTENVQYNWQGETQINGITRKMLPNYQGVEFTSISNFRYSNNTFLPNSYNNPRLVMFAQKDDGTVIGCEGLYLKDLNYLSIKNTDLANSIKIYPVPVMDQMLTIESPFVINNIEVIDIIGKTLLIINPKKMKVVLKLPKLPPGTYFIRINSGGKLITKMVIM